MQRFFFAWVIWLMVGAMVSPAAAVFPPACAPAPQPPRIGPAFDQSYTTPREGLCKETLSFSEEFSLQEPSEDRLVFTLPHPVAVLAKKQERGSRLRPIPVPACFPLRVLFPRKLSPPSAEDDPFLS